MKKKLELKNPVILENNDEAFELKKQKDLRYLQS